MSKVFGLVVVYNSTLEEIHSSVSAIREQCDKVIVCNNSDNGFVYSDDVDSKIFNFNENLGIAKAQSVGMKWAFENGADFIVQLDQDSILAPGTITKLKDSYANLIELGYKVGVIGPRHYDKVTEEVDEGRLIKGKEITGTTCEIIHATISSASLIPKEAYELAGPMDDGLFIDSVDWEYCWRLKELGYITVRVNDLLLGHRVGNGKKKIIGKIDARVPSPIRHYYHTRNLFLLSRRGYVPFYWKASNYLKLIFKVLFYRFIFDDGKERHNYIMKGIKDGVQNKYGRIDNAKKES